MRLFSAAALLTVATVPLFAAETFTVHYVEVPVSVVGSDGAPVRGLTKANFQLFDGRRPVDIASFDVIDFDSPASVRANASTPAVHRSFLILFDLTYSSPSSLVRAQAAARTFVQKNFRATDLVGVATIDVQRGYHLVTNFTTDRSAVAAAIDHPGTFRGTDPLQLAGTQNYNKLEADQDLFQRSEQRKEQSESRQDQARNARDQDEQFLRDQVHRQFDLLAQLAASLRDRRGRTQVIFLSEGFNARVISGRSARDRNEENDDANMATNGYPYKVDNDRRFGSSTSQNLLQSMTQAFQASGIVLHAIDLRGLRTLSDLTHGEADDNDDGLFLLARPTGGDVFRNSNDLSDNFGRLLRQQNVVYVLGFQAPVVKPGKPHELNLKLVDGPRGASLTYRRGYFEGGTRSTAQEQLFTAADIIVRDLPQSGIRVETLATAFPGMTEKAPVPVVVDISGADLLKAAKDNQLAAEVFMYAFDEEGAVRDRVYQRLKLDVDKVGDKLRQNGLKYVVTLQLTPGKYAIKTLVRTPATEQNGYIRSDVTVPKSGETVLLLPFVLDDPQAWLLINGDRDHVYPFHVNGTPFVPSASGAMPAGSVHKLVVFVCNALPEELKWETTPQATLLGQFKTVDATKLILQLDDATVSRFGVMVKKGNEPPLTATISLNQRP
jgi:VWFA-related protein